MSRGVLKVETMVLTVLTLAVASPCFGQGALEQRAEDVFRSSFAGGNPSVLARVTEQDEAQRLCSLYRNAPPPEVAKGIERAQRKTIRYPASGKLIGDWRVGKGIAEGTKGLRYDDRPGQPSGGNCYACHQLARKELAYGTLGPSLLGYGKSRGRGKAAQRRTYEQIYNGHAFAACSAMPRFGHNGVLTPEQIAHLVALLLDPASEVNR
jgi:L-cysteine S-thiosulfotransferase